MTLWNVEFIFTFNETQRILKAGIKPECFKTEKVLLDEIKFMLKNEFNELVKISMCIYGNFPDKDVPQWYWNCSGKIFL